MAGQGNRLKRNMRSAAAGLAVVSVGTTTSPATAQTLSAIGSTFGAPTREIDVTAGIEAQYDSNVARSSSAGAAARRLQKRDVRFRPALEANISVPTGVGLLTLQGVAGYDFYARNSRLNRERIDLTAGAATRVAICDVALQGGFARNQNDLADLSIVPGDIQTSSVNVQTVSRIGGTASCGAEVGLRPTVFAEYRHSNNSANLRKISNFNAFSYGGGLSYTSPAFGVISAFVGRNEFDYPDRPTTGLFSGDSGFDLTFGGVRLDRRLGARLQFNGQVTYVDMKRSRAGGSTFNGLNWDLSLALRAGDRTQFVVGTSKQVDASAGFSSRATEVTTYSAAATYVITPLLRVSLSGAHRKRKFDVDALVTPVILLPNDNLDEAVARLTYSAGRRITLTLTGGYQDRDADIAIYKYHSYRASIGARVKL